MLDFCLLFGCKYTWNTAGDHREILFWGLASGAAFNLCLRVKEEARTVRNCARTACIRWVLRGGASTESPSWQSSSPAPAQSGTLLSLSSPPDPGRALSLASPTGMGGAPIRGMVMFTFPAGGQTWMSGSALVHPVCSLKRSKQIYFWHKTWYRFLWLCVSRAWMDSVTTAVTPDPPKCQQPPPDLLGKQFFFYLADQLSLPITL